MRILLDFLVIANEQCPSFGALYYAPPLLPFKSEIDRTRLWPFAEISLRGKGDPERELGGVMSKHRDHLILSRCLSKGSAHGAHSSVSACQNGQSRVESGAIPQAWIEDDRQEVPRALTQDEAEADATEKRIVTRSYQSRRRKRRTRLLRSRNSQQVSTQC